MKHLSALAIAIAAFHVAPAAAQEDAPKPAAEADAPWPDTWFEIFKLAPGKQEAFIRFIAQGDEVLAAGGQPPVQLFFHENGAEFDVILFKPVTARKPTAEQEAAMAKRSRELGLPTGPAYFIHIRELIASHSDTRTTGPVSAAQWLARLDKWRAANPSRQIGQTDADARR